MKVSNKLKVKLGALMAVGGAAVGNVLPVAADTSYANMRNLINNTSSRAGVPSSSLNEFIGTIINVVLAVVGLVAVFMIILGGFTYMTSQGDAAKVKRGKDTLLYGIIGLIIALVAFAVVNFVLDNVFGQA